LDRKHPDVDEKTNDRVSDPQTRNPVFDQVEGWRVPTVIVGAEDHLSFWSKLIYVLERRFLVSYVS
jgi:hypothetical protein